MTRSKPSARRSRLFSLADREARREARPKYIRIGDDVDDDGCPICVASRNGGEFDFSILTPRADGGPPPIDPNVLVVGARKAMVKHKPVGDTDVVFWSYGAPSEDGMFLAEYSVDGRGRIFWTSPTGRALITQVLDHASQA